MEYLDRGKKRKEEKKNKVLPSLCVIRMTSPVFLVRVKQSFAFYKKGHAPLIHNPVKRVSSFSGCLACAPPPFPPRPAGCAESFMKNGGGAEIQREWQRKKKEAEEEKGWLLVGGERGGEDSRPVLADCERARLT